LKNPTNRWTLFLTILLLCLHAPNAFSQGKAETKTKPRVTLFMAANGVGDALWYEGIVDHSQKAANALDIDLTHVFAGTIRPTVLAKLKEELTKTPKPDYIVFGNQRSLGPTMLEMAERHGVKAFLYIAPLSPEDHKRFGGPRGKLKNWIGELIPNDEQAGFDLAQILITQAREKQEKPGETLHVVAITGRRSTSSAKERQKGLMRALAMNDDVELHQVVSARWQTDVAEQKFNMLRRRYTHIDIVWAANDPMALGVVEAVKKIDTSFNPAIGGVDWIPPAITAVQNKKLVATMGGHNFDIAYVMALLRNHYDGIDFAEITGTPSLSSKLVPISTDNVDIYNNFFKHKTNGKIDYAVGLSGLDSAEVLENLSMQRFISLTVNNHRNGEL